MSTTHHKDNILIAEYTLGLLEADELARMHALLGKDDTAAACALEWEKRLLDLTDALTPPHPDKQLLFRVQATLGLPVGATDASVRVAPPLPKAEPEPRLIRPDSVSAFSTATAPPAPPNGSPADADALPLPEPALRRSPRVWQALSAALAILAAILALPDNALRVGPAANATLQPASTPAPQIVQVAIMQAPGTSSTPGWVLTVDSQQNVALEPKVDILVPDSDSVYLWTYSEALPQPRFLGVVDPTRSLTLPMEVTGEVRPGQIFEMTQEPNATMPNEPDGPILFIGRTVSLE